MPSWGWGDRVDNDAWGIEGGLTTTTKTTTRTSNMAQEEHGQGREGGIPTCLDVIGYRSIIIVVLT